MSDLIVLLRREGFSRTSLRLTVWGRRSGLLRLTARGMMRPGNNRLGDLACEYDLARVVFFTAGSPGTGILADYALLRPLARRLQEAERPGEWYPALWAVREAVLGLWEGFPTEPADAPRVSGILRRFLGSLGRAEPVWAGVGCIMELLAVAGLRPELGRCASCGGALAEGAVFSPREEGLLCPACAGSGHGPRLDAGVLRYLERLARGGVRAAAGLGAPGRRRGRAVMWLLDAWFRVTIGSGLGSLELLVPEDGRQRA